MKRKSIELTYQNILLDAELNILRWYDFQEDAKVLSVGTKHSLIRKFCAERGFTLKETDHQKLLECGHAAVGKGAFDYVVFMESLEAETAERAAVLLREAFACLHPSGVLLVTANNRYAIRHFCGEKTPYEQELFEELEGQTGKDGRRCYGLGELEALFTQAGIGSVSGFAVFPSLRNAKKIYSFSCQISGSFQCYPWYEANSLVFAHEEKWRKKFAEGKEQGMEVVSATVVFTCNNIYSYSCSNSTFSISQ